MKIESTFFAHHKTRKLEKLLGNDGIVSLLKLWNYAEQVRPDGVLSGMDESDIELVSDWKGDEGMFVYTLVEIGFLNERGGVYCLHDWAKTPPVKTPPCPSGIPPLRGGLCAKPLREEPPSQRGVSAQPTGGVLVEGEVEETVSDAGRFHVLKRANPQIHDELKRLGIRTLSKEGYDLWKDCYRKNNAEIIEPEIIDAEFVQILEGDGEPADFDELEDEDPRDAIIDEFDNEKDYYEYLIANNYVITPVDINNTGKSDDTLLRENMGEDLFGNYVKMLAANRALAA